jgi:hypothetical protein
MNFSLIPFAATWIALACAVPILAPYRRRIAGQEDDMLHVTDSQASHITEQAATAPRLAVVARWGKLLTIVGAVCGVVLVPAYFYQY